MNNTSATTDVLRCVHLAKTHNEGSLNVEVLKDIDFSIAAGEQVAILGTSGEGKSTLLHLLGGLDKPTRGEVWIAGQNIVNLNEKQRGHLRNRALGFIYQLHHLLPEFTAVENVVMPLRIRGIALNDATEQAENILKRVGLGHRLTHKPAELSGGERQRTAIARALVTKPQCIMADEPTGNLDQKNADQVYQIMLELNQEMNTSLLLVTHDLRLAERTDKIYVLADGKLSLRS
ncbi:MAG: lipoprotein-releasing ABC transporter ATP-binding protein LolD [Gammaproteobacteria bacterium]|nr:lipoprotein-releasing ABC transporter ATP-binding protein LolD [Gammaproteobacteria bacterium]